MRSILFVTLGLLVILALAEAARPAGKGLHKGTRAPRNHKEGKEHEKRRKERSAEEESSEEEHKSKSESEEEFKFGDSEEDEHNIEKRQAEAAIHATHHEGKEHEHKEGKHHEGHFRFNHHGSTVAPLLPRLFRRM